MSVIWIDSESGFNTAAYSYVRVVSTQTYYMATDFNPPYGYQLQTLTTTSNWFANPSNGFMSILKDVNGLSKPQWVFYGGDGQWPSYSQVSYAGFSSELYSVFSVRMFNGTSYVTAINSVDVVAHYLYLNGVVGTISLSYQFSNNAVPGTSTGTVLTSWSGNPN